MHFKIYSDIKVVILQRYCCTVQLHLKKLEYRVFFVFFFYLFQNVKLSYILDSLHVSKVFFVLTLIRTCSSWKSKIQYLKILEYLHLSFIKWPSIQYKFWVSLVLWNHNNGVHQESPRSDVFRKRATTSKPETTSEASYLGCGEKELDCCSVVQSPLFRWK